MFANFINDTATLLKSVEVFDALPLPSALLTPEGEVLYANKIYAKCWQSEVDLMVGRNIGDFSEPTRLIFLDNVKELKIKKTIDPYEYELFDRYYMVSLQGIFDELGFLSKVLVCGSDITDIKSHEKGLKKQNKQLQQLTEFDHLTGLMNRRAFDFNYAQCLDALKTNTIEKFSLIVLDVDDFKKVNDEFGHLVGDEVLTSLANVFQRVNESASWKQTYRYGGEEFVVLLPNFDLKSAYILAEELRKAVIILSASLTFQKGLAVSISCGVVSSENMLEDNYFEMADKAMYQAKRNKKNCVYYYDSGEFYRLN